MAVADLSNPQVAEFDILINGTALSLDMRPFVNGVTVDESVMVPGMFALELVSSFQLQDVSQWIDDASFSVGNVVEVKLGYGNDLETLIIGEITGLEPEFIFDRLPVLVVRGYDRRHRLQRGRKTRTFVKQKDSDVASRIASEAGLSAQTVDSSVMHDYVMQSNQTDLEFLQERGRRIQYETLIDDKKLIFRPVPNNDSATLVLGMDDHLLEFYPRLSTARQVSEVSVRGWNPREKKEILSTAQAGDSVTAMGQGQTGPQLANKAFGSATAVVSARPLMTQAEADQMAKATLGQRALSLIEGEGLALGRTDLRAGKVIKIEGVGQRFGGQYYVTTATHHYTAQGGYRTGFQVRRNAS